MIDTYYLLLDAVFCIFILYFFIGEYKKIRSLNNISYNIVAYLKLDIVRIILSIAGFIFMFTQINCNYKNYGDLFLINIIKNGTFLFCSLIIMQVYLLLHKYAVTTEGIVIMNLWNKKNNIIRWSIMTDWKWENERTIAIHHTKSRKSQLLILKNIPEDKAIEIDSLLSSNIHKW